MRPKTKHVTYVGFWSNINIPAIVNSRYIDGFEKKCRDWDKLDNKIIKAKGDFRRDINDDRFTPINTSVECVFCKKRLRQHRYNYNGYVFLSHIFHYVLGHSVKLPRDFQKMLTTSDIIDPSSIKTCDMFDKLLCQSV